MTILQSEQLLEKLARNEAIDVDEINELATSLEDQSIAKEIWGQILFWSPRITEEPAREMLAIGVFEVLAEESVHPLWIESLPRFLASRGLWWIIFFVYRGSEKDPEDWEEREREREDSGELQPADLLKHMRLAT